MPAKLSWRRALLVNAWAVLTAVAMVGLSVSMPVSFSANRIALAIGDDQITGPYHVVVIGDSFTSGSNEGGVGPNGWPVLVWKNLAAQGIKVDPVVAAAGATGYVQRGLDGTVFPEDAARVIAPDDNVIVFFGGRNDTNEPLETVTAAARRSFADARTVAPNAPLIVIGPIFTAPNPSAPLLALRDALAQQTAEAGGLFVDPIAEGWLTAPGIIGADGVHPTNAGHQELAARIGPIIQGALGR